MIPGDLLIVALILASVWWAKRQRTRPTSIRQIMRLDRELEASER